MSIKELKALAINLNSINKETSRLAIEMLPDSLVNYIKDNSEIESESWTQYYTDGYYLVNTGKYVNNDFYDVLDDFAEELVELYGVGRITVTKDGVTIEHV